MVVLDVGGGDVVEDAPAPPDADEMLPLLRRLENEPDDGPEGRKREKSEEAVEPPPDEVGGFSSLEMASNPALKAVSYTHLTLPTTSRG